MCPRSILFKMIYSALLRFKCVFRSGTSISDCIPQKLLIQTMNRFSLLEAIR